ncbi:LacI family transcriptional regulator [Pontimonas sp.]|nr:LacI family transcriptional regulator [Pontimonas sp.]
MSSIRIAVRRHEEDQAEHSDSLVTVNTLSDVAKLAGVSKSTASRALSGRGSVSQETQARVSHAVDQLGFVPSSAAESLATGRSRNIAVVTPFINRWFYSEVIDGVESALIGAGYDLTLYRLTDKVEQRKTLFDYFLVRKGVDAVIALTLFISDDEVTRLRKLGKPIVGIGGLIPSVPTFSIDDVATSRRATEHLIELGHKQIIHIGGDQEHQLDFEVHSNRLIGFRQALDAAHLSHDLDFYADDFDIQGGYRSALKALTSAQGLPTGVFAGSDEIALGVLMAAKELGLRVPEDLSIIGIDGHPLGETFGITTMNQHPATQGAMAVSQALAQLGGGWDEKDDAHLELQVDLKVRGSTGPPPAGAVA